ncbi:hypothetical protein A2164_00205 [Candidatus Curtissbacteria bacterium RBG_13_35_7]|uniref:ParB/Sulfiredoxin domain-containing protein n=1 Tax=Candidatus Curtissbacteria bacterium RBG_13_35_7 TaxID=1797705 RepID=A0A1F5G484_9BACT|nr:MAG: hypothetical protein A2164_00205 [Candidatus Curtissbacteria bacterium RBG_13_35_7]
MPVKIKMIETFLSVLNSRQPLRKFYELVLLKKARYFSKIQKVNTSKLNMGIKKNDIPYFLSDSNSLSLESSPQVKFLKEIDAGKKMTETKYFKILQKVRSRDRKFASKKCKEFSSMYKKIKNGNKIEPIFLIKDAPAWKVNISVLSPQVKIKSKDKYVILDGHHRASAMWHLGYRQVPAKILRRDFIIKFIENMIS